MVIWTPNDTWANRFRRRYGLGIRNRTAVKLRESLKKFTPEKQRAKEVGKEIEWITTTERIKQMHINIKKMSRKLEKMGVYEDGLLE